MASLWTGNRGTVGDYTGFKPSADAEAIQKAIQGIGTNEETLIHILTARSHAQQQQLTAEKYHVAFGEDLKNSLKSDLSGNFERLMVALVTPPAIYDAKELKKAMKVGVQ